MSRKLFLRNGVWEGHLDAQSRAGAICGMYGHDALKFLDAFFDTEQTETVPIPRLPLKADAVVVDKQAQRRRVTAKGNTYLSGLGVPGTISKGLLDDSIDTSAMRLRQAIDIAFQCHIHHNAKAAGKVLSVPFQRSSEAEVIQDAGAQPHREIAHSLNESLDQVLALSQLRRQGCS
jgi:hypothetical protein